MARTPAKAKDRSRASTLQRSRAIASDMKAPARKSPQLAAKPTRADKSALRRDAILAAALKEFSTRGFAAARLEDVAQRAGVGKGTIYLHFHDKEALLLERLTDRFVREIYGTERRQLIRLVMTEGPRFPELAEFHYNHVVKRAMGA